MYISGVGTILDLQVLGICSVDKLVILDQKPQKTHVYFVGLEISEIGSNRSKRPKPQLKIISAAAEA